jgi:lycopene cyclase CruA
VISGLERGSQPGQHDPSVGDILISVADAQRGQQYIWEGFAGRDGQLTVYLFYYDRVGPAYGVHSLLDLFEDYFALLPTYKRPGDHFQHHKPVYGFIPARHTERRNTAPLLRGVLPVGDAAAQQSPLTFTGFGSHVRNLARTTSLLRYALRWELLEPHWLQHISAYQSNVALHWVFSRFMHPWQEPNTVNQLQNVFARVLNELGTPVAERFFKDQMRWGDYGRIVNHTLHVYQPIISTALTVLGPVDTLRWIIDYGRFTQSAMAAAVGRRLGTWGWHALERVVERIHPGWSLVLRSRYTEWRAMGWIEKVVE